MSLSGFAEEQHRDRGPRCPCSQLNIEFAAYSVKQTKPQSHTSEQNRERPMTEVQPRKMWTNSLLTDQLQFQGKSIKFYMTF